MTAQTIAELNAASVGTEAVRHHGSGLWFIRSRISGKVLNSAMSYDWVKRSMVDHIDFETRHGIKGA